MTKYYTKCGREGEKSTKAATTGYGIDEISNEQGVFPADVQCRICPWVIDVEEYVGGKKQHKRLECRAGSQPPNHTTEWLGSLDDKNNIHIRSLDHEFMESVIEYCKSHEYLSADYNAVDLPDCRRVISVYCDQNKAGITAKAGMIAKFFPDGSAEAKETEPAPETSFEIRYVCRDNKPRCDRAKKPGDICCLSCEKYKSGCNIKCGNANKLVCYGRETIVFDPETKITENTTDVPEDDAELNVIADNVKRIAAGSIYQIGEQLSKAHDILACRGHGTWGEWLDGVGFSRSSADNYMQAYKFISTNLGIREDLETKPQSLLFEVARPSAPEELVEKVLAGEITTHKEYKAAAKERATVEIVIDEPEIVNDDNEPECVTEPDALTQNKMDYGDVMAYDEDDEEPDAVIISQPAQLFESLINLTKVEDDDIKAMVSIMFESTGLDVLHGIAQDIQHLMFVLKLTALDIQEAADE